MGKHIRAAMIAALQAERAAKKMTIAELAAAAGVSERTALRQLNEQRDINLPLLDRYAAALGVKASDLMLEAERREADRLGHVIHYDFGAADNDDVAAAASEAADTRDDDRTDEGF